MLLHLRDTRIKAQESAVGGIGLSAYMLWIAIVTQRWGYRVLCPSTTFDSLVTTFSDLPYYLLSSHSVL